MFWWRNVLYAVFALFAAPLEYHVEWSLPVLRGLKPFGDALLDPLKHGTLFYYSAILVAETLFRLEMHDDLSNRTAWRILKLLTYFLVIPFIGFLLYGADRDLGDEGMHVQVFVALMSLISAIAVHLYVTKAENIMRKAATP